MSQMRRHSVMRLVLAIFAAAALYGQDAVFEVVSIKPVGSAEGPSMRLPQTTGGPGTANPAQVAIRNATVTYLVTQAFGVRLDQVEDRNSLDRELYDIAATVPPGATAAQLPAMLQQVLRDRFGLRQHVEDRVRPVFVIRLGRSGPKFRESAPPPEKTGEAPKRPLVAFDDQGFLEQYPEDEGIAYFNPDGRVRISGQRAKVGQLLFHFEAALGRLLVDETGLTGRYDFRVTFAAPGADAVNEPLPNPREALEALGLTLEAAERPVRTIVIDAVNPRPTEN